MDNLTLQALIDQIRPTLLGRRCVQVGQTGPRTFHLELASTDSGRLILDFAESQPLCFFSRKNLVVETASPFIPLVKKWLCGASLRAVSKRFDERLVHFEFARPAYRQDDEILGLVVELVPQWGNVYLLDPEKKILGALLPSRAERRALRIGMEYSPPGKHGDLSIQDFTLGDEGELPVVQTLEELMKRVRGLSPTLSREVWVRAGRHHQPLSIVLAETLQEITTRKIQPHLYRFSEDPLDLFPAPFHLASLQSFPMHPFPSMNEMIETAFEQQDEAARVEGEKRSLRQRLQVMLKKFKRIADKLEADAEGFSREVGFQKFADLILAHPAEGKAQGAELQLVDWFDPKRPTISVPMDPRLSSVANAQRFYERSKRAKRGLGKISSRAHSIQEIVNACEEALRQLPTVKSLADLDRLSRLLERQTLFRPIRGVPISSTVQVKPADGSFRGRRKCRVLVSSDQREILVGRNSKENDRVTLEYARPEDYWFHVADYAGSHVVLVNPNRENLEASPGFLEAAQVAAYYSQARNAKKVSVHWTQRKFVKKPKRARPGLVTLSKFQSLWVEPKLPLST